MVSAYEPRGDAQSRRCDHVRRGLALGIASWLQAAAGSWGCVIVVVWWQHQNPLSLAKRTLMLAPLCFALLVPTRRDAIHLGLGALASLASRPAVAFDNAVPEYADYRDKPKRPGTPPKDLGIAKRTVRGEDSFDEITFSGLRGCDGKPNCFSTTGDFNLEDRIHLGVDTLIKPWRPPADDSAPFKTLVQAIKAYPPGGVCRRRRLPDRQGDGQLHLRAVRVAQEGLHRRRGVAAPGWRRHAALGLARRADRLWRERQRLNYIASSLCARAGPSRSSRRRRTAIFDAAEDAADQTFDQDRRRGTGLEETRLERARGERAVG